MKDSSYWLAVEAEQERARGPREVRLVERTPALILSRPSRRARLRESIDLSLARPVRPTHPAPHIEGCLADFERLWPRYCPDPLLLRWQPGLTEVHGKSRWHPAFRSWEILIAPTGAYAVDLAVLMHEAGHIVEGHLAKRDRPVAVSYESKAADRPPVLTPPAGVDPARWEARLREVLAEREDAASRWAWRALRKMPGQFAESAAAALIRLTAATYPETSTYLLSDPSLPVSPPAAPAPTPGASKAPAAPENRPIGGFGGPTAGQVAAYLKDLATGKRAALGDPDQRALRLAAGLILSKGAGTAPEDIRLVAGVLARLVGRSGMDDTDQRVLAVAVDDLQALAQKAAGAVTAARFAAKR